MADKGLTTCPKCAKMTRTVSGLCVNCWYPKTGRGIRSQPEKSRASLTQLIDVDWLDPFLWGWLPVPTGVVFLAVGLLTDFGVLVVIGAVMIGLRIGVALFPWDEWW